MSLLTPTPKSNDPESMRKAIQQLKVGLGPNGEPTFAGLDVTGAITAYNGRDVIRYALMMGLIHK